ncbi:HPr family phosphocarrier protein [Shewanella intestini]|uniref:HPr family phosphocarrier protein n=1 Tax=Shewanella intestini TaxID=2017544 RepID=A0ABS5I0R4_9GAMM|nr:MULTISPECIES: HPr family phosphocarrier protein [Shewanella]MBR9727618.1 HPr family phosphocarrier protein [Shewanella intestini]MRG35232.1 HPr family phosphocarrier protein [Shewanella sp. XMDDZSB0408]
MLQRQVTISNKLGLHARAATKLATLAATFDAQVTLHQGNKQASAASVLGILMLESSFGKTITLNAQGQDAQTALDAISALIDAKFEESC